MTLGDYYANKDKNIYWAREFEKESRQAMKGLGIESLEQYILWRTGGVKANADPSVVFKNELKDSGVRQNYESGAVRDTQEGKPRIDLIPPEVLVEMGIHYAQGAKKYADRNWEKGIDIDRYVASFDRHWTAWKMGETDEPHLRAAIWNLMAIMHHEIKIQAGELPESLIGVFGPLAKMLKNRKAIKPQTIPIEWKSTWD